MGAKVPAGNLGLGAMLSSGCLVIEGGALLGLSLSLVTRG